MRDEDEDEDEDEEEDSAKSMEEVIGLGLKRDRK